MCNHLARVLRKRGVDRIFHNMPSSAPESGSIWRAASKCKCLRTVSNKRCRRVNLCRVDFFDLMFIQHDWCKTFGCSCLVLGPGIAGCRQSIYQHTASHKAVLVSCERCKYVTRYANRLFRRGPRNHAERHCFNPLALRVTCYTYLVHSHPSYQSSVRLIERGKSKRLPTLKRILRISASPSLYNVHN